MREDKSKVRYRIDIWDLKNTSPTAVAVDKAVSALGLKRIGCADVPDPSGMKHKQIMQTVFRKPSGSVRSLALSGMTEELKNVQVCTGPERPRQKLSW